MQLSGHALLPVPYEVIPVSVKDCTVGPLDVSPGEPSVAQDPQRQFPGDYQSLQTEAAQCRCRTGD